MEPFARRRLGTSDVMLPQLGFGGAPVGNLFGPVSDADAEATLTAAWNAGVRFYDTSPFYGRTLSEHRLGQVVRRYRRDEVILSTKVGRVFFAPDDPVEFANRQRNWPHGLHFEYRHDYSYDAVMRSYEDSLQRLGMNRIDLLLIHDLDEGSIGSAALVDAHFSEAATGGIRALNELKAEGLIGPSARASTGSGRSHASSTSWISTSFSLLRPTRWPSSRCSTMNSRRVRSAASAA